MTAGVAGQIPGHAMAENSQVEIFRKTSHIFQHGSGGIKPQIPRKADSARFCIDMRERGNIQFAFRIRTAVLRQRSAEQASMIQPEKQRWPPDFFAFAQGIQVFPVIFGTVEENFRLAGWLIPDCQAGYGTVKPCDSATNGFKTKNPVIKAQPSLFYFTSSP